MKSDMSVAKNQTYELFSAFMPRRKEISNRIDRHIYDLRLYPENYFLKFNPEAIFQKWALTEIDNIEEIPAGMFPFRLEGGLYAVLTSPSNLDDSAYTYIFTEWLPSSEFLLDHRPHYDILLPGPKPNTEGSTQAIYIPVKPENGTSKS